MDDFFLGTAFQAVCLFALVLCLSGLILFSCHNLVMLTTFLRLRREGGEREAEEETAARAMQAFPKVLVQLPIYNERHVAERLLGAVCRLDWPRDRLTIQVLDDSDDETSAILDRSAARLRAAGHPVEIVRRPERTGYKAGALAYGLARANAEFVAIFDADFVPPADFLRRVRYAAMAGFLLMVLTGSVLFVAEASHVAANSVFRIKLALIALALTNALVFELSMGRQVRAMPAQTALPAGARVSAALSLALWFCVAAAGRLIAYF